MAKPKAGFNKNPQNINKDGRPPKGYSITEWFRGMFKANPKIKEKLGKKILDQAIKGDIAAQKLIWNYMDGMPLQATDLTSLGEKIEIVFHSSLKKKHE